MQKQITKYIELVAIFATAVSLWWSANRIIQTPEPENWWLPISFFSLFFITWSLGSLLIKNSWLFFAVSFLSLATSLFWTREIIFGFVVAIALLSLWSGRKLARDEMSSRIKISIWNPLRLERRFFVFAVTLLLVGQYFFAVGKNEASSALPEFKIGDSQAKYITKVLSKFDPALKSNKALDEMTVDDFILQNMSQDDNIDYSLISGKEKELIMQKNKELILQKGRENFSKMLERKVAGDEKILDVFTEIVNIKIGKFADNNVGYLDQKIPIVHWIFSGLLFVTIFSLGMFFSPLLILLTWLLFKFMIAIGMVEIDHKSAEVEVIV